ncbi:MAG: hypothetical protein V4594_07485 [Bacteroidota bacterium]
MDILSYLTELIKTRKEVGIVGLGTIYKKKSPGRYDAETHSFLPPSFVIDFTPEVWETVALAEFVSRRKNLSYDSSAFYVEQFTESLQKQLQEQQEVSFGELGTLKTSDGILTFIPGAASNAGFEFYGLPQLKETLVEEVLPLPEATVNADGPKELDEQPVVEETLVDEIVSLPEPVVKADEPKELDDQPVYEEISEPVFQSEVKPPVFVETIEGLEGNDDEWEPVVPFEEKPMLTNVSSNPINTTPNSNEAEMGIQTELSPKEQSGLPAYVMVIIAGAAVLAIAVGLYLFKPELFKGSKLSDSSLAVADSTIKTTDTIAKIDSPIVSTQPAETVPDTVKQDTTVVAASPVATDSATTWEVVGASVIGQKEADWAIEQFKRIGVTAKIIPAMPGKRRIKISVATFPDEMSARAGRKELVTKLKNPELYIFQNKHTHK